MILRQWVAASAALALALVVRGEEVANPRQMTVQTDYLSLESAPPGLVSLTVQVLSDHPHDPNAYTQGLLLDGDVFIEGTGRYGHSELREVDVMSGQVIRSQPLLPTHFGEGVAMVDDRLIQLTWRENVAHIWDRETFEKIGEFQYTGEGWGLVYDGTHLVMSNGSDRLRFRDPDTFAVEREVAVKLEGQPLQNLNELAWAEGLVWANVWFQDFIVGIDPANGEVRRIVDASSLRQLLVRQPGTPAPEVLNGIAYNASQGTYYVTGKYWPRMFEVQFVNSGGS